MGGGLVGHDVDGDVAGALSGEQFREHVGGVGDNPDTECAFVGFCLVGLGDGVVEVGGEWCRGSVLRGGVPGGLCRRRR